MANYDNNNQGAIFKNDRKQKDTDPEYKGSVTVGGVEYWVSVWLNKTKDGKPYFSHKYTPKGVTQQPRLAYSKHNPRSNSRKNWRSRILPQRVEMTCHFKTTLCK